MGNMLSGVIDSLDTSKDQEAQIKETLNTLYALGESRNEVAYAVATSTTNQAFAPIQKVLLRRQQITVSASVDGDGITKGITDAIGNLMSGQILDGVNTILKTALGIVLGGSSGSISSKHEYALIATQLGALLRIDIDVYCYHTSSKSLKERATNVTAFSSLISTIDPMKLTQGDLRGIVSLSYGSSTLEEQQLIFEAVKEAWQNDRKLALGQALTSEDIGRFQSAMVPSKCLAALEANLPRNVPSAIKPIKIGRPQMIQAEKERKQEIQTKSSTANNASPALNGAKPAVASLAESSPVYLWMQLFGPAEEDWIAQMKGALSGFNIGSTFTFVDINGGLSGTGVQFQFNLSTEGRYFDLGVRYLLETVIPNIEGSGYLGELIKSTAVQYEHPNEDNRGGLISNVQYKFNRIHNSTKDSVVFYEAESLAELLRVEPGTAEVLNGKVGFIGKTKSPPPPQNLNGTAGADAEPLEESQPPVGGPQVPALPEEIWVTYDVLAEGAIIRTTELNLEAAEGGGYRLHTFTSDNNDLFINYDVRWNANF